MEICSGDKICSDGCPFKDKCWKDLDALEKACLDLINRQKAEIERLQKEKFDSLNCQFAEMYATTLKIATKKAKSEAIKEFAERLCKEFEICRKEYKNVMNDDGACAMIIAKSVVGRVIKEMEDKNG